MISVAIIDDHTMVREGIKSVIKESALFCVTHESITGEELMNSAALLPINMIILDLSLPGVSGLSRLRELKSLEYQGKIVVLSMYDEIDYGLQCIQLGASAYLNKSAIVEELITCLKTVSEGRMYISDELAQLLARSYQKGGLEQKHNRLSPRENEVLALFAQGKRPVDIAKELFLSIQTVSTYKMRIMNELDLKSNADLIFYCIKNSLVEKPLLNNLK